MQEQYDLFTTNPGTSGYRLSYMEIFNWGTFHNRIYRIKPLGNNSLLTGANASGKSTLIDALLTLLVPAKKDRFYNQSSGNERKGDRTEETYVLGNYGNIQSEGESTRSQQLRDKSTYSIILVSFANSYRKVVTLFQVRWFVNGELKCIYGYSCRPLSIETDLLGFDGRRGDWKRTLERRYNTNVPKKQIEFYDTIKDYKDRIIHSLGLRSDKALTLFNQIVGVKVLNDLDDFIRNNMLEQRDAENEYTQLNESFATLIGAKTTIEKVKEQIAQLEPINKRAGQLDAIMSSLQKLQETRSLAVYWFAQKNVELANNKIEELDKKLTYLNDDLQRLVLKKTELNQKERELSIAIETDNVGQQISTLKKEIDSLERIKINRQRKLNDYNKKAIEIGFNENPTEQVFIDNRDRARKEKNNCQTESDTKQEEKRQAKNKLDSIAHEIESNKKAFEILQKNKNNISGREAEIREMILQAVGATPAEIPFIGELIRVKDSEKKWESSIEKILHNFALRLIVPVKYYKQVSQFVNSNNLKGRIVYQRYEDIPSLNGLQFRDISENSLLGKVEFNPKSTYSDWVRDVIYDLYNYTCVSSLEEFFQYSEKAVTIEGLIKSVHNKHEKDDRLRSNNREHYVLGWDNKEKIAEIRENIRLLHESQRQTIKEIQEIDSQIKKIDKQKECYDDLFKLFTKYEEINWEETAQVIQEKTDKKNELEATNDRVKALQKQRDEVKQTLSKLENETIKSKEQEIYHIQQIDLVGANKKLQANKNVINTLGAIDVSTFETDNKELLDVNYENIDTILSAFQTDISKREEKEKSAKERIESEAKSLIRQFKIPSEEITQRFKDWRSDVHKLPDPENIHLIGEYQNLYNRLNKEDLVRHQKRFDDYLQETLTNKVSDFRMFFSVWEKSIKETIKMLNESLKAISFGTSPSTYIQLVSSPKLIRDVADFRKELDDAIPNFREVNATVDGKRNHFENKIQPLIKHLGDEQWRKKVMDVRNWFSYKAEEFYMETDQKRNTYESMGQLSGGEKAQLTYTILGSAIAYQFGLTKEGVQPNSFRFIAIDEAFKAQDEDKARYLISLCKQLHLQLLVVTPSDNIHIVENDISFVHYVERHGNESRLFEMPIETFKEEREKYLANDNAS